MRHVLRVALIFDLALASRKGSVTPDLIVFCDCTARSVLLTLVWAGGRAARPPRAPGRARAGRRQPQLAAPVRARRPQGASKPRRVARRNPAAPTSCVPTPRGRQRAVPAAREGSLVATGDRQGRALPAPSVRRPLRPARPPSRVVWPTATWTWYSPPPSRSSTDRSCGK